MPEESKESKARKLAAARRKLKEYQQRGVASGTITDPSYTCTDSCANSDHVSSNLSERSDSELQLNGSISDLPHSEMANEINAVRLENVNFFNVEQPIEPVDSKMDDKIKPAICSDENMHNINAIQVLIAEKSQLNTELNKFRTLCREKDLEMEELRVQNNNATKRVDELTQRVVYLQKQQEQQKLHNAELQHKLSQASAQQEDNFSHINELKQQLTLHDERLKKLDADFKNKCNELELSQLRVRQLSDESNITKDNRVESLTQMQFMHEQQIRDLQAMVQQLTQEKDQANTQYQTYVQQLNAQVQRLNERNNELIDETAKLQEREKQLVDHIQQLEKEIQKNITKQAEFREEKSKATESSKEAFNENLQTLQERINEFESERYEFQLKIKSQEDRLNALQCEVNQKDIELEELKEHLANVTSEQPDKSKLLATMESDKVAASRALTQNVELKKQLDELELRFVQLTNDKADLMNLLDSEQYTNREMQTSFKAMEERLRAVDERFKFKDEEMIRLSHENEELKKKLEYTKVSQKNENEDCNAEHYNHEDDDCDHQHFEEHEGDKKTCHHSHKSITNHEDGQNLENENNKYNDHTTHSEHHSNEKESFQEDTKENLTNTTELPTSEKQTHIKYNKMAITSHIASEEAVEKLQQRFTQLMTQCADLTEEKQRLEHLVMQLQSETETIGEYIALYQTQRRILKQREYEKAAQTAMLQAEREQMRERLAMLINLVNSLGMELPQNQHLKQQIDEALVKNIDPDDTRECHEANCHMSSQPDFALDIVQTPTATIDLNSPESQQILHKIQGIITEIKENTKELPSMQHSVDQLNCCSGKFEVV